MATFEGTIFQNLSIKCDIMTGAAANTNIAVPGINTEDKLLVVIGIDTANAVKAATVVDHGADASITSAGNIQSTVVTSAERLIVLWLDINQ